MSIIIWASIIFLVIHYLRFEKSAILFIIILLLQKCNVFLSLICLKKPGLGYRQFFPIQIIDFLDLCIKFMSPEKLDSS